MEEIEEISTEGEKQSMKEDIKSRANLFMSRLRKRNIKLVSIYQNTTLHFRTKSGSCESVNIEKRKPDETIEQPVELELTEEIDFQKVDDILKDTKPSKTFLYKHLKVKKTKPSEPYLNMNIKKDVTNKQKFLDYINFDFDKISIFSFRNKDTKFNDRGYYDLTRKGTSLNNSGIPYYDVPRSNYTEVLPNNVLYHEDPVVYNTEHLYEDLRYNTLRRNSDPTDVKVSFRNKIFSPISKIKINGIITTIRESVSMKNKELKKKTTQIEQEKVDFKEDFAELYDTINFDNIKETSNDTAVLEENEYLTPIQFEYADVSHKSQRESFVDMVAKFFDQKLRISKEGEGRITKKDISHPEPIEPPSRPLETLQQWNNNFIARKQNHKPDYITVPPTASASKMADRPLPVPVESESYFMRVDRNEAAKLLENHTDGVFVLRPSSQPEHIYSISVVYSKKVYNVGIRRRADGRVALGYSKESEESFPSVKELIESHYNTKLILVEGGKTIGSTLLKKIV